MKSLYEENFNYSSEALKLDIEFINLVVPLFEHWIEQGYSPREIESIMHGALYEIACIQCIQLRSINNANKQNQIT